MILYKQPKQFHICHGQLDGLAVRMFLFEAVSCTSEKLDLHKYSIGAPFATFAGFHRRQVWTSAVLQELYQLNAPLLERRFELLSTMIRTYLCDCTRMWNLVRLSPRNGMRMDQWTAPEQHCAIRTYFPLLHAKHFDRKLAPGWKWRAPIEDWF